MQLERSGNSEINACHAMYKAKTGLAIGLGFERERTWFEFLRYFSQADLSLVLDYLNSQIRKGDRRPNCLRFRNLIEQLDYFEEELALARKAIDSRKRDKTAQERILEQFRPVVADVRPDDPMTAKPASEAAQKALDDLRKFKKEVLGVKV